MRRTRKQLLSFAKTRKWYLVAAVTIIFIVIVMALYLPSWLSSPEYSTRMFFYCIEHNNTACVGEFSTGQLTEMMIKAMSYPGNEKNKLFLSNVLNVSFFNSERSWVLANMSYSVMGETGERFHGGYLGCYYLVKENGSIWKVYAAFGPDKNSDCSFGGHYPLGMGGYASELLSETHQS
jgi:hypothetical protein